MSESQDAARGLTTLRIVVAALAGGLTLFVGVVWIVAGPSFDAASITRPDSLWLLALLGFVAFEAVTYVVVGRLVVSAARSRHGARRLSEAEVTAELFKLTLIRAALVEGLGFFGGVVFLVAAQGIGLVVAVLCAVGLLASFPTDGRYQSFREALTRPE